MGISNTKYAIWAQLCGVLSMYNDFFYESTWLKHIKIFQA